MSRKFNTFCTISDYVNHTDPELYNSLEALCVTLTLNSTKGKPGVTFMVPQDEKVRNEIIKLSMGEPEDAQKAINMLNAMILRDVVRTPSEMLSKKATLANSLYPPQLVEIKGETKVGSVSGIEFSNGAKAIPDPAFKTTKDKLAVWKMVSGSIPTSGGKSVEPTRGKMLLAKTPKGKVGSYQPSTEETKQLRFQIMIAIENTYANHEMNRRSVGDMANYRRDVYLEYTLSLWNHVYNNNKGLACDLLALMSFDKVDLYYLLEPHKRVDGSAQASEYLIPQDIIVSWWSTSKIVDLQRVRLIIENELKVSSDQNCMFNTDRMGLMEHIHQEGGEEIIQQAQSNIKLYASLIKEFYLKFYREGTINGKNIYCDPINKMYKADPEMKLLHDELRYITYRWFKDLECDPQFDRGRFNYIVNVIGDYLHSNAEERRTLCRLVNPERLAREIAPAEKCLELKRFVHSTAFGFVIFMQDEEPPFDRTKSFREAGKFHAIYDMEHDKQQFHNRIIDEQHRENNKMVVEWLKSVPFNTLDTELQQMLRDKVGDFTM